METLDWIGSAPNEIAVLNDTGVDILTSTGQLLTHFPSISPGQEIVPLRDQLCGDDRLVWFTAGPLSIEQWMFVLDKNGFEGPLSFMGSNAHALMAGDWDKSGTADVTFLHAMSNDPLIMMNQRTSGGCSGPTFSTAPSAMMLFGTTLPQVPCVETNGSVIADFTNDGHPDLWWAERDSGNCYLFLSDPPGPTTATPTMSQAVYDYPTGHWWLDVTQPVGLGFTPNAVQVLIYEHPNNSQYMNSIPLMLPLVGDGASPTHVDVHLPSDPFDFAYQAVIRFVFKNTQNVITQYGPALMGVFTDNLDRKTYFEQTAIGSTIPVQINAPGPHGYAGGFVPRASVGPTRGAGAP